MNLLTAYAWVKPTGLGSRLSRTAAALANRGYGVDWVTVSPPSLVHPAIRFHRVCGNRTTTPGPGSFGFWMRYQLAAARRCRMLAAGACDGGFAFSLAGAYPLQRALHRGGKPLVVFVRSNEDAENRLKRVAAPLRWLTGVLNRRVLRTAELVVFVNRTLLEQAVDRVGASLRPRAVVLYNDLPPSPAAAASPVSRGAHDADAPPGVATVCGRLDRNKNVAVVLRALAEPACADWRLTVMGDGPRRGALAALAAATGVAARVDFLGWRDDAAARVAGADCFILPSRTEGVSNALLEALAADRLCLASDIPEHRELFPDGVNLFAPHDPGDLAARLAACRRGGPEAAAVRRACRTAADRLRFDWDEAVCRHIADALEAPSAGARRR